MGPFFEQFGAVPAGPMTAFKLLRNNEQVVSARVCSSTGSRGPAGTHASCRVGVLTSRMQLC